MKTKGALRSSVNAALLIGAAASACPWPGWGAAGILTGRVLGYYYGAVYTTLLSFGRVGAPGGQYPVAGLTAGSDVLLGTASSPGRAFALSPPKDDAPSWSELVVAKLGSPANQPLTIIDANQIAGVEPADVFLLTNAGKSMTKTFIYRFTGGAGGAAPTSGVTLGPAGVLYGTATGGANNAGLVYKLMPNASGGYTQAVVYAFAGGIGGTNPTGGVVFGPGGLLYGTTAFGGSSTCTYIANASGCGVVYDLTLTGTEKLIYKFPGGEGGAGPASLTVDSRGSIYGSTTAGGSGQGTIFQLTRSKTGAFSFSQLYAFTNGVDGHTPNTPLLVDSDGAIYGTAQGGAVGLGTLFMLAPPVRPKKPWTLEVLHTFTGDRGNKTTPPDGAYPSGGLLIDLSGALYGITTEGGANGTGSVYKLVP